MIGYGANFEEEIRIARRRLKLFKIIWFSILILIVVVSMFSIII